MGTQGASSMWGSSSHLGGLESNWGIGTPAFSSGANMNLLGYGNNSLSNNQGHMQSGASSVIGDSLSSNTLPGSNRGSGGLGGGWGAPGTIPPSQSTSRIPTSAGVMQGNLPVSGAQPNGPQINQQSGTVTSSQSPGPNGVPLSSSQGNSAFGNNTGFQKTSTGNTSSGLAVNAANSISSSNGSNAQGSDNLDSTGWGLPSSTDNPRITGTVSWGNPNSGSEWDQQNNAMSQSQSQLPPSSSAPNQNPNTSVATPSNPSDQRPSSWAQAAGKGLNLQPSNPGAGASGNTPSPEEMQKQEMMRRQIESHDGWGKKPIRQDTQWNVETSPKVQRKFSTAAVVPEQQKPSTNMWNNNNGTAIWEANKDANPAWNSNTAVARAPGQPPSNWQGNIQGNMPQKMPEGAGSQWGASAPGQAPGANKAMSAWGTPSNSQAGNNPNWGGSTETGSWGGNFGGPAQGNNGGSGMVGSSMAGGGMAGSGMGGGSMGGGSMAGGNMAVSSMGGNNMAGNNMAGNSMAGNSMAGNSMAGNSMGGSSIGGSGISTLGDADNSQNQNWGDNQRSSGNGDGAYWGDQNKPQPQQQGNWTAPGSGMPNPQAVGPQRGGKLGSGWGDPVGPPDPKIDDGTGLWAANSHHQVTDPRAASWGAEANQGQWNPAIGKPKQIPANPAQFGGVDELNWNIPKEDVWSEESMGGWDDADMGMWNYNAQQANSSWNSATGWNKDKRTSIKDGAMKFPGGNQPPQMRSRLLQQLMDMGFKRDEAQHALINNNMNLQNAVAELCNRRGAIGTRKDTDMDMFQMDGNKPRMSGLLTEGAQDDISDTQNDSNSFVPNINPMQNTPFNNAQSKIPNQFPFNNGPSLSQSSLNPNNPSINNALQQKLIQKFQSQQPPPPTPQSMNSINPSQGPMGRSQLQVGQQNTTVHQQMAQQQILQQLRMAVQAGLISPQLLNQQLPAPVLVMLQQLLQQQQSLQQLINTQQMLQQPKVGLNPMMQRQQLEQIATKINTIKQQILILQKNIAQAQNSLLNKSAGQSQPPQQPDQEGALQSELNNMSISTSQPQSRLNQWKRTTPDKESPEITSTGEETQPTTTVSDSDGENGSLNKTVGSKPVQQSNSTPNLRRYDELGIGSLGGDTTWSTTPTSAPQQSWPSSSTPPATSSTESGDMKESQTPMSAITSSSSSSSVLDSIPAIPEFVPGKPWQGLNKNVEDDPHITPGSYSRSLSVNTIKDDYLLTLTKSSPTNETTSWPTKPTSSTPNLPNKPWSTGESLSTSSLTGEVWGMPKGGMSRPPPGIPQQHPKGFQSGGYNRQNSWAAGQTRSESTGSWAGDRSSASTALILKNLTPQIDGSTLRTLCLQHGPLQCFYLNLAHGQALVKYNTKEETMKAQKSLNTCLLGNTTIVAEFVSDQDAIRFIEQQSAMSSAPSQWSQMGQNSRQVTVGANSQRQDMSIGSWGGSQPQSSAITTGAGMWGHMGGGNAPGVSGGSGGALWETLEDNSTHNLLGNMLGETM